MGFTIYYRSTRRVNAARAKAIREAVEALIEGRTWLSCEPVGFFSNQGGHLFGGSKPNFQPSPDDAAAAAEEGLPDGTVHDMIDVLCKLSADFAVDWELSHDHDPAIGCIRDGECEPQLRQQVAALGDLGGILREMTDDFEGPGRAPWPPRRNAKRASNDEDDDPGPSLLPFRPKGG